MYLLAAISNKYIIGLPFMLSNFLSHYYSIKVFTIIEIEPI